MTDKELQRQLQSSIPDQSPSYWATIDARLVEIEQTDAFDHRDATNQVMADATVTTIEPARSHSSVTNASRWLMTAAAVVIIGGLGAFLLANRASSDPVGQLDLSVQPDVDDSPVTQTEETDNPPAALDEETDTPPAVPDEETNTPPAALDEETNTPPAALDDETNTPPAALDEETDTAPAVPDEARVDDPLVCFSSSDPTPRLAQPSEPAEESPWTRVAILATDPATDMTELATWEDIPLGADESPVILVTMITGNPQGAFDLQFDPTTMDGSPFPSQTFEAILTSEAMTIGNVTLSQVPCSQIQNSIGLMFAIDPSFVATPEVAPSSQDDDTLVPPTEATPTPTVADFVPVPNAFGPPEQFDSPPEGEPWCVVDIVAPDTLNVRSGPGVEFEIRGALRPDACILRSAGSAVAGWTPVYVVAAADELVVIEGWVSSNFVLPATAVSTAEAAVATYDEQSVLSVNQTERSDPLLDDPCLQIGEGVFSCQTTGWHWEVASSPCGAGVSDWKLGTAGAVEVRQGPDGSWTAEGGPRLVLDC